MSAAIVASILYCLELSIPNNSVQIIPLSKSDRAYFTPIASNSSANFWIRNKGSVDALQRSTSPLDFNHRTWFVPPKSEEWQVYALSNSSVSVWLNQVKINTKKYIGLEEGDQIDIKYPNIAYNYTMIYTNYKIRQIENQVTEIKNQLNETLEGLERTENQEILQLNKSVSRTSVMLKFTCATFFMSVLVLVLVFSYKVKRQNEENSELYRRCNQNRIHLEDWKRQGKDCDAELIQFDERRLGTCP